MALVTAMRNNNWIQLHNCFLPKLSNDFEKFYVNCILEIKQLFDHESLDLNLK